MQHARFRVAAAAVEQVEIQQGADLAHGSGNEASESELALPDAEDRLAVVAATRIARDGGGRAVDRNLGRPQRGVPVRVDGLEVVDGVEHDEAENLEPGLVCAGRTLLRRRIWCYHRCARFGGLGLHAAAQDEREYKKNPREHRA